MEALTNRWAGLSPQQRLAAVAAVIAVVATLFAMVHLATRPSMALLYAELDEGAAGGVIRSLDQRGVSYEVRGGAIYVDAAQRDELRLTLAGEGLPATGAKGYELLDGLSGFGTTAQMFDAAYWRAKEGELARTIQSSGAVSAVRVHIAHESANPFARNAPVTASVFVTGAAGAVSSDFARALRYLVASAVPRLLPEDVSIIDGSGRLLTGDSATPQTSENDAENALRLRVQRLVEARVGPGNAVVELSIDRVTETESIVERLVDPASRVAVSVDTEERVRESENGGQALSVASNLPDGEAAGDKARSQNSEARERIAYQVSETTREIRRVAGDIRRISVAVLVNGRAVADTGPAEPLPEPELEDLKALVASAVGFNADRGDQITIRSMIFEPRAETGSGALASAGWASGFGDPARLAQLGILGLVVLALGLFVVRPLLKPAPSQVGRLALERDPDVPLPAGQPNEIPDGAAPPVPALPADAEQEAEVDPVERLRRLIEARKDETVEVLRTWLDEGERVE